MSPYRKIDPRLWTDEKFSGLSRGKPCARELWFYLLTGPHTTNFPGLANIGEAALVERIGGDWTVTIFRKHFAELRAASMAFHDQMAQVLWLPNVIKYDAPTSINWVKSWGPVWSQTRNCELKSQAYQTLKAFMDGKGDAFRLAFRYACPEPPSLTPSGPIGTSNVASRPAHRPLSDLDDAERAVLAHLNQITGKADLPPNAQFRAVSKELRDRLAEGAAVDDCCAVLDWLRKHRTPDWIAGNLDQLTPFRLGTWERNVAQARAWKLGARAVPEKATLPEGFNADELFRR